MKRLEDKLSYIKDRFKDCDDLIIREFQVGSEKYAKWHCFT